MVFRLSFEKFSIKPIYPFFYLAKPRYWKVHDSWNKTHIFAAITITQYWLNDTIVIIFFSDNPTIIYWIKEKNSCFLRITSKAPVRIQQHLYTVFEWIWLSNLQNFIFSCHVLCEKIKVLIFWLKFQVSKYRLRWNAENMTSSIKKKKKSLHCYFTLV